ncbi:MAG TPA: amidohydrolase family protein [Trebonia sp.]|nr:amidohydrolase family protein [Trebonia sp.]
MTTPQATDTLLPFIDTQRLTDHHCHGVHADRYDIEGFLTEGDGGAAAGGSAFDSLIGLAFRRHCPPLLDLPAFCAIEEYSARRFQLGPIEVGRRFLAACGLGAICVDTGFQPVDLLSPAETAALAGTGVPTAAPAGSAQGRAAQGGVEAFEIVRLEQVADHVAAAGAGPAQFAEEFRSLLAARVAGPGVVGLKSVAAYRVGLDLAGERPSEAEVTRAAEHWLGSSLAHGDLPDGLDDVRPGGPGPGGRRVPRLAHEALHRFLIWTGADLGLPIQFHVGYGDRDIDLHRCNPLLLTPLLRALEPTGVPVMLLHNYPYHREAGYLAQVFKNVYADLGLTTHNVGSRAPAVLAEALEMVPFGKFLYSSDAFGLPELYYLASTLFRSALSQFLSARLESGDMTLADAERVARLIGQENAARVYRLPA